MKIKVYNDNDIFLVDDDLQYHFLIERYYKKNSNISNKLICLESGEECLGKLESIKKNIEKYPALILMDVNMPSMTGFECVNKIRQIYQFEKTPIIAMLSSSNYQKDIDTAYTSGADEYFEKPLNLNDLEFVRVYQS